MATKKKELKEFDITLRQRTIRGGLIIPESHVTVTGYDIYVDNRGNLLINGVSSYGVGTRADAAFASGTWSTVVELKDKGDKAE